jgi:hypothetical protein
MAAVKSLNEFLTGLKCGAYQQTTFVESSKLVSTFTSILGLSYSSSSSYSQVARSYFVVGKYSALDILAGAIFSPQSTCEMSELTAGTVITYIKDDILNTPANVLPTLFSLVATVATYMCTLDPVLAADSLEKIIDTM